MEYEFGESIVRTQYFDLLSVLEGGSKLLGEKSLEIFGHWMLRPFRDQTISGPLVGWYGSPFPCRPFFSQGVRQWHLLTRERYRRLV